MKNSFRLTGKTGKDYGYSYNPNTLKDRFLQSGEEEAVVTVQFVSNAPTLTVTRETPNSVWNEFANKYSRNLQND